MIVLGGIEDRGIEEGVLKDRFVDEVPKVPRTAADVKNNAENLVYSTEKSLREMGDKIDDATKDEIEAAARGVPVPPPLT